MMNKLTLATVLTVLFVAPVLAQNPATSQQAEFYGPTPLPAKTQVDGNGGFSGPNASMTTVDKAKTMSDDAEVILQGNIERLENQKDDLYTFRDSTGAISVEISGKRWKGQTITPTDRVQLEGKVDKEWDPPRVDVKKVIKLPLP